MKAVLVYICFIYVIHIFIVQWLVKTWSLWLKDVWNNKVLNLIAISITMFICFFTVRGMDVSRMFDSRKTAR